MDHAGRRAPTAGGPEAHGATREGGSAQRLPADGLDRRRALRVMVGALAVPVLARLGLPDAWAAGRALHTELGQGQYDFEALDAEQRRTVTAVVDQIIPETDTPGAVAARVPQFVDRIIAELAEPEERDRLLAGLADLTSRSRAAHGRPFHDCPAPQQLALLEELQREAAQARQQDAAGPEPFIRQIKQLTLWGYYTSEIGMTHERPYDPFPGADPGCRADAPR